jgi:hypothetical protein
VCVIEDMDFIRVLKSIDSVIVIVLDHLNQKDGDGSGD